MGLDSAPFPVIPTTCCDIVGRCVLVCFALCILGMAFGAGGLPFAVCCCCSIYCCLQLCGGRFCTHLSSHPTCSGGYCSFLSAMLLCLTATNLYALYPLTPLNPIQLPVPSPTHYTLLLFFSVSSLRRVWWCAVFMAGGGGIWHACLQ